MKENVLDVLIYLFENYMFDSDELEPDQETLSIELAQAGFDQNMIEQAFEWLENLALLCEDQPPPTQSSSAGAIRHYCDAEQEQISAESRGFLLRLEQCGVLDPVSREMVIDQLMALGAGAIEIEHVKWVVLMLLCNFNNGEGISELTENLILDGLHSCIH